MTVSRSNISLGPLYQLRVRALSSPPPHRHVNVSTGNEFQKNSAKWTGRMVDVDVRKAVAHG